MSQLALCKRFLRGFFLVLSWEVQYITKHFMTGPAGKNEFCFPSTSMLLLASPQETMRVSGKQNSLAVSLGASHKVLKVELFEVQPIATVHQGYLDYIHMYIGLFSYVKSIKELIPFGSFSC